MFIKRIISGKEKIIQLTQKELYEANKEFITNFMEDVYMSEFGFSKRKAKELAVKAYEKYSEGNGLTEYEAIRSVVDEL